MHLGSSFAQYLNDKSLTNLYLKQILGSILVLYCLPSFALAQKPAANDLMVDYERVLHVEGLLPTHSVSNKLYQNKHIQRVDTLTNHPWQNQHYSSLNIFSRGGIHASFYDPEYTSYWRNLEPGGINDDAVWQGKGLTSSFSTGLFLKYRFLTASVRPVIIYNQNADFSLSRYTLEDDKYRGSNPRSIFSYPFDERIDLPQRYGSEPFWTFNPGPSYLKLTIKEFEAGLSNEQRWWGGSLHYPIIMSNNAPGFWHYFMGTESPKDIYIGDFETTILWGKLIESEYFDQQSYNDERYISGINLSFQPKFVPNLTLGFSRVFVRNLPPEGIPVRDLWVVFGSFVKSKSVSDDEPGGNDTFDQMLSLSGRWVFPQSGFEIYGEWARNDHSWNLRDAVGEPEHSRGYTLGLQKTHTLSNQNIVAVNAEIVQLETTKTRILRSDGSFYEHRFVRQGYTQYGQVMGVGYGPGSNSQILKGKYFFPKGKLSTWFRRTVFDNDYLYSSNKLAKQPENQGLQKFWLHNFEMGTGASLALFFNRIETEIGFELMREFNDDYLYKEDKTHLMLNFRLRYQISKLR